MAIDPGRKAHVEAQSKAKTQDEAQVKAQSRAQTQDKAQVGALLFNEAFNEVSVKYSNYSDVFLAKNVAELPKNTEINEHAIELEKSKQPSFRPIYSLGPVELEMLKTYIETNLANSFIRPSKSSAGALISFDQKPDRSLRLCVDYQGLNNITIKNRYLLPLIGELLDWLGQAKRFTQLDLTNAYHLMRICKGDEWQTAFRIWYSYFKYQVMLFGLFNASATFQEYVNMILAEKLDIFVIIYLDDMLIYTENQRQPYVEAVRWVLDQLQKYSFFTNLKKCYFHQDDVCFLEYVVLSKGISMEVEQIEIVRKWLKPKSVQEI